MARPRRRIELTHPDKRLVPRRRAHQGGRLRATTGRSPTGCCRSCKDRPVTLERLPEGLGGGQAALLAEGHARTTTPTWIPRVGLPDRAGQAGRVRPGQRPGDAPVPGEPGDADVPLWLSRVEDLDRPDFVLFDLDPGKATFADVVAVAKAIHRRRWTRKASQSFVKTSGKTGLHVLTAWAGEGGFDEARDWARRSPSGWRRRLPDLATVEIRKAKRGGRVYIDVLQNARGHHAVPPYVVRGRCPAPPCRCRSIGTS